MWLLLDKGADIHAKNADDWTVLHHACRYSKDIKLVRLLLDRGADINAKDNNGLTALDIHSKKTEKT